MTANFASIVRRTGVLWIGFSSGNFGDVLSDSQFGFTSAELASKWYAPSVADPAVLVDASNPLPSVVPAGSVLYLDPIVN